MQGKVLVLAGHVSACGVEQRALVRRVWRWHCTRAQPFSVSSATRCASTAPVTPWHEDLQRPRGVNCSYVSRYVGCARLPPPLLPLPRHTAGQPGQGALTRVPAWRWAVEHSLRRSVGGSGAAAVARARFCAAVGALGTSTASAGRTSSADSRLIPRFVSEQGGHERQSWTENVGNVCPRRGLCRCDSAMRSAVPAHPRILGGRCWHED